MSNFDFLKGFDDNLWNCGIRIEEQINKYPFGVHSEATAFLEYIVNNLRLSVGLKKSRKPFYNRLDEAYRKDNKKITYKYKNLIYEAYQERNKIHADLSDIEKDQYVIALNLHKKLYYIAKKYFEIFGGKEDELKGIAPYKAPKLDFSPEELELIEIPDLNDIVEFSYDYCVACGEPNHSSYSIYCENCNNLIDNANTFISIRNHFGKDATFTKEKLIEFGIHEGYVNSLISFLNKSELFVVKGRLISFNNSKLDSFIVKIDNYIKVGDLITQFRQNKITPSEIKQTPEYRQGSFKQDPFYQFYKIVNEEIIYKFEYELISTEDIQKSIDFTTITQKELTRWYNIQLKHYNNHNSNEAFNLFNNLLIDEYLSLKRQGLNENDIINGLNLTKSMLEFFPKFRNNFDEEVSQIKKDLILKYLTENKSKAEVIELAGISKKEYNDIIKYSKFKNNEFGQEYEKIVIQRKESLLINLTENDLFKSCDMAKITIDDFYKWYDEANINSDFYIRSTRLLMDKFLDERKKCKSKAEAAESIGLKEKNIDYWLKRKDKIFDEFQDKNLKVIVDLILEGLKNNKTKSQIANDVDISVKKINVFLDLGQRKTKVYAELYNYYESNVIPRNLSKFLDEIKNKSLNKALTNADLTKDELNHYYITDQDFHNEYLSFKMDMYIEDMLDGRTHERSLKKSNLSNEEYIQLKQEIDKILLHERMKVVKREILNNSKSDVAAKRADVTVDDVYGWYHKGKNDKEFKEFSEFFFNHYIEPNVLWVNKLLGRNHSIDQILKIFDINFIEKDFEIWQKEGLINAEEVIVDLNDDEDDGDKTISIIDSHNSKIYSHESGKNTFSTDDTNSDLYNAMNKNSDNDDGISKKNLFFKQKKPTKSSSILKKDEKDIEELKKEIIGKK